MGIRSPTTETGNLKYSSAPLDKTVNVNIHDPKIENTPHLVRAINIVPCNLFMDLLGTFLQEIKFYSKNHLVPIQSRYNQGK